MLLEGEGKDTRNQLYLEKVMLLEGEGNDTRNQLYLEKVTQKVF